MSAPVPPASDALARRAATAARVLLLAGALVCSAAAQAQGSLAWNALSPAQRNVLASLRDDWTRIPAEQQQKWLLIADRYPSLPASEQERLHARMGAWAQLSPSQRERARQNYQEAQRFDGDDRRARWEAYRALPPEQRNALARSGAAGRADPPAARRDDELAGPKSNIVQTPPPAPLRRISPSAVQAAPGATTRLTTRPPEPPRHQQTGLPKIQATPEFVEPRTLLPQRGAQGAAASPPPARGGNGARADGDSRGPRRAQPDSAR